MIVAEPRPAASVLVLRDGHGGLEILFVRRSRELSFMGGAWVFPGGSLSADDGHKGEEMSWRRAAMRETREEAGIDLRDPGSLVPLSRWITPELAPIRFDTRFYLANAPVGADPVPDGREVDRAKWWTAEEALGRSADGSALIHFPTIRQIELIADFATASAALAAQTGRTIEPIMPRLAARGEGFEVVMPGEPGYEGG